jgi:hypothetical protein
MEDDEMGGTYSIFGGNKFIQNLDQKLTGRDHLDLNIRG